jgi:hypothetical protein
MVEVFITDVCKKKAAAQLSNILFNAFPSYKISFDLEDKDKILRVESICNDIESGHIIDLLKKNGHYCEILNQ